ncbi:MAG: orotidine-5'-phosphate decarboxylase [Candidatus Thermoplasmatota archaeon]
MEQKTSLIIALDNISRERALYLAELLSNSADAFKVGYPLVLSYGIGIVKEISSFGYVLCDFKVADIPYINSLITRKAKENFGKGIIVHGFVGRDAIGEVLKEGIEVYVVVEMTHEGAVEFMEPIGEKLAKIAKETNANGIIAPGTRPERIAKLRKIIGKLKILSPGIGLQGGNVEDAIKNGADYVIVGRSICESKEPKKSVEDIINRIREVRKDA